MIKLQTTSTTTFHRVRRITPRHIIIVGVDFSPSGNIICQQSRERNPAGVVCVADYKRTQNTTQGSSGVVVELSKVTRW